MNGTALFFVMLGFALMIAIAAVVAGAFADVAEQKGHNRRTYWHWVFWFAPAGIPLVIALPDVKTQQYQQQMLTCLDELNDHLKNMNQQPAAQASSPVPAELVSFELPEL